MLFRVAQPDGPAFQLRKGEEGLSVFDSEAVEPPLTEAEVLGEFRAGSVVVIRSRADVEVKGLRLVPVRGAASLMPRLQDAHAEIQPAAGMTRAQFKQALRELE